MEEDIIGVIYALPARLIERFFEGKRVFVKYLGREPTTRLVPGHRLFFYASHGKKQIPGEATIKGVEFMLPNEVKKRYPRSLFLALWELERYVGRRPNRNESKPLLVLRLARVIRYPVPFRISEPVTMAGRYMTNNIYGKLIPNPLESGIGALRSRDSN